MNNLCDGCETVNHCLKHGCIPKQPVQRPIKTFHDGKPWPVQEPNYKELFEKAMAALEEAQEDETRDGVFAHRQKIIDDLRTSSK